MKKIFLSLGLTLGLVILGYAQTKNFTIDEAVQKQRSTLAPARLSQLAIMPNGNVSHVAKNALVICTKGNIDTLLKLSNLNLPDLKAFPSITWVDNNTFRYEFQNILYTFNTVSKLSTKVCNISDIAENTDIHPKTLNVAYTVSNDLYITKGDKEIAITNEKNKEIVNGQAAHRNEFGIANGTFWSTAGSKLAFYRMDQTMVTDYPLVDINTIPAKVENIKYPMAGQKSHEATIGVYDVISNKTIYLKTEGPKDQYLTNITWSADDKTIYVAIVNRAQNEMTWNAYNAEDGSFVRMLFEEKHPKYVEPEHPLYFFSNNKDKYITISERTGYDQLYIGNLTGGNLTALTTGTDMVTEYLGLDLTGENAYYVTSTNSGLERQLNAVNIASKKTTVLTKGAGVHTIIANTTNKIFIDNLSSHVVPRQIRIINGKGKTVKELLSATNPLKEYAAATTIFGQIKAANGNTILNTRTILPLNFDSTKKYPAIVYLYNGPHLQLITDTWLYGAELWMHYMAQKGYIVYSIDGRGSSNRGLEFENVTHRNLGTAEMADQLKGLDILKQNKWVDGGRVGIFGWSYGGYMTTNLMLTSPKTYKVGVAGGPVTDWSLYEIMYTERYMDTPEENPEGYKNTNLALRAKDLQGKLMQIHGTIDDVVVWQHSQKFIEACVSNNIPIDYMAYPNHKHNVLGKDRTHLIDKVCTYFIQNL